MPERRSERASLAAILARVREIKRVVGSDKVYLPGGAHHAIDAAIEHIEDEASALLGQVRQGIHENPGTLAIYGNPPGSGRASERGMRLPIHGQAVHHMGEVIQLRYRRTLKPTGYFYHNHAKGDYLYSILLGEDNQRALLIARDDGQPLWGKE